MSKPIIIGEDKTGEIINLEEHDETKWVFGIALCEWCRTTWLAQVHNKADPRAIECPKCNKFRSYFIPQMMIKSLFDVEVK